MRERRPRRRRNGRSVRVQRVVRDFRRDEMAHQQVGPASLAIARHRALSEGSESNPSRRMPVSRWSARRRWPSLPRGEGRPALKFLGAADRGPQAMLDVFGRVGAGLETVQHVDFGLRRQQAARGKPLAEMGDEEGARAGGPQRRRSPVEADPVGVGLDHRGARPGAAKICERAPVVGERAEIDGQAAGRVVGRGEGGHASGFSRTATVGASKPACAST